MAEFSHHRGTMVVDQPQALPCVLVALVVQSKASTAIQETSNKVNL